MPSRIQFDPHVSFNYRPGIAAGLAPLADVGYEIFVEAPEMLPHLGWGVRLSRPDTVKAFRTTAATPDEWAAFVAGVLRSGN
jgi:hypothetical protein